MSNPRLTNAEYRALSLRDTAAREVAEAELGAALDAISSLVLHVQRMGGYMEHDDQASLREARAILARHGR